MPDQEPEKVFRDIGFNEEVTIKVPGHVAYGYLIEYSIGEQKTENAQQIFAAIMRQLIEPSVLTAREAEQALQAEKHRAMHEQVEGLVLRGQAFPFPFGGMEPQ